ncbi:MAG: tetratricopeptide repeat protein [Chloroflexia bacterium]
MTKQEKLLLALILLLALALRLWLWSRPDHPLANDETEYLPVAQDLVSGRGFVFYDSYRWLRAPLYPLFLALFLWLGGGNARVATMAQVVLSTATVYGFYLLARRLFPGEQGGRAGLLSALLAALLLPFATFPSLFMAETLFTFLFVAWMISHLQVPEARPERRGLWTAVSGMLLGLCALTRAVALAFFPLAALWLYFSLRPRPAGAGSEPALAKGAAGRRFLRRWALPLLFLTAGLLPILPWTVHNALTYHRFILLDTGASYSLWAYYDGSPRPDIEEINRQLEAIPNPADRQAYAVQKGLELWREDPGSLLRKLLATFPYLLRIKPIEDRFLKLPYREPSLPYFLLALLLDDGLYALIAVASLAALVFPPVEPRRIRGKTLALLWLLYNLAAMMLMHAEARYRQLLFPVLIPWAALALAEGRRLFRCRGWLWRAALLGALLAGWAYCFIAYSPWEWMATNLRRGFYQMLGQVYGALGRPEEAIRSYEQAIGADPRHPEPYYDLALALERMGRPEEAEATYASCWRLRINYLPCSTSLGNLLRRRGEEAAAREAFRGRYVAEEDVVAWAWENLALAPIGRVDVGGGLDAGYVYGVYASETGGGVTFRWTTARARFRMIAGTSGEARLRLRLAAPGREEAALPAVLRIAGQGEAHWTLGPYWATYESDCFPVRAGEAVEAVLESPTFVPREKDPASADTRALGVQVDWLEMVIQVTCNSGESGYNIDTPFP